MSLRARLDEAGWLFRRFLWRNFFVVTLVWFVVVIAAVQWFALAATCSTDGSSSFVFGTIPWFVPDLGTGL